MSDIDTASMIPGWSTCPELNWLGDRAIRSNLIAEVGSWRGRTTRALADNTSGTVVAVDTWDDRAIGDYDWWREKESPDMYRQKDWLWREFERAMGEMFSKKVLPMRMTSVEAARLLALNMMRFDMIFIDAGHEYEDVFSDIVAWKPLLREGGIFCGHDYGHPKYPGVARAVNQLVGSVATLDSIWCAA